MKNIISNFSEAQELVNKVAEFDDAGMQTIACLIIDTCSARFRMDACEIADNVCELVHQVNKELGAYQLY